MGWAAGAEAEAMGAGETAAEDSEEAEAEAVGSVAEGSAALDLAAVG